MLPLPIPCLSLMLEYAGLRAALKVYATADSRQELLAAKNLWRLLWPPGPIDPASYLQPLCESVEVLRSLNEIYGLSLNPSLHYDLVMQGVRRGDASLLTDDTPGEWLPHIIPHTWRNEAIEAWALLKLRTKITVPPGVVRTMFNRIAKTPSVFSRVVFAEGVIPFWTSADAIVACSDVYALTRFASRRPPIVALFEHPHYKSTRRPCDGWAALLRKVIARVPVEYALTKCGRMTDGYFRIVLAALDLTPEQWLQSLVEPDDHWESNKQTHPISLIDFIYRKYGITAARLASKSVRVNVLVTESLAKERICVICQSSSPKMTFSECVSRHPAGNTTSCLVTFLSRLIPFNGESKCWIRQLIGKTAMIRLHKRISTITAPTRDDIILCDLAHTGMFDYTSLRHALKLLGPRETTRKTAREILHEAGAPRQVSTILFMKNTNPRTALTVAQWYKEFTSRGKSAEFDDLVDRFARWNGITLAGVWPVLHAAIAAAPTRFPRSVKLSGSAYARETLLLVNAICSACCSLHFPYLDELAAATCHRTEDIVQLLKPCYGLVYVGRLWLYQRYGILQPDKKMLIPRAPWLHAGPCSRDGGLYWDYAEIINARNQKSTLPS